MQHPSAPRGRPAALAAAGGSPSQAATSASVAAPRGLGSADSASSASSSASRLLLLLTALPVGLAVFAFVLQLQGGFDDPSTISLMYGDDTSALPGWQQHPSKEKTIVVKSTVDCGKSSSSNRHHHMVFPFQPWHASLQPLPSPKICICTTTSSSLDQILPWLFYHRALGVQLFILFVEGQAALPESAATLKSIEGVKVIFRTRALEEQQARSRVWNETWLAFFFFKPCNYELFVKQSLNMEMAIVIAREAKADWILHIDTDELLYPANSFDFSLQRLFQDVPPEADTVIFPNYESAIERDDLVDPFSEVSMFKKNFEHVARDVYFGHYRDATRGNPNYFLTYGNGKSAARMQDHLRPNGAHRWHNYKKAPKEYKPPEAAVLHYTYAKFSDLTSRRDRCGCKPNAEDVKKCFMLDFDRAAFIIASTQTEEQLLQWYRDHVVWLNKDMNAKLLKKGLFGRIHTPQVIIRGIWSSGIINETKAKGLERVAREQKAGGEASGVGSAQGQGQQRREQKTALRGGTLEEANKGSRRSLLQDEGFSERDISSLGIFEKWSSSFQKFVHDRREGEAEPPLPSPEYNEQNLLSVLDD